MRTPEEFWSHVDVRGENDCWLWQLSTRGWGHGQANWRGKITGAHRLASFLHYGHWPLPNANHVDDCNPACCNPKHLYEGTAGDNVRDLFRLGKSVPGQCARASQMRQQTHCKRGHEYTPDNTGTHRLTGWRYCKACEKAKYVDRYARKDYGHTLSAEETEHIRHLRRNEAKSYTCIAELVGRSISTVWAICTRYP